MNGVIGGCVFDFTRHALDRTRGPCRRVSRAVNRGPVAGGGQASQDCAREGMVAVETIPTGYACVVDGR